MRVAIVEITGSIGLKAPVARAPGRGSVESELVDQNVHRRRHGGTGIGGLGCGEQLEADALDGRGVSAEGPRDLVPPSVADRIGLQQVAAEVADTRRVGARGQVQGDERDLVDG